MQYIKAAALAAAAAALLSASTDASAEIIDRDYFINASGTCNGALPTYEGALRKRPIAIRNEGTTAAFVSCSIPRSQVDEGYTLVGAYFTNSAATEQTINCTLVDGVNLGEGSPISYYPGSVTIPVGMTAFISWDATTLGLENFETWINLSCNLPANSEIGLLGGYFGFENGVTP